MPECIARQGNGRPFATKASLRRAIENGDIVKITNMGIDDLFCPVYEGDASILVKRHPEIIWSICGPDPRTSRKWWATIYMKRDGTVAVK